MGYYSDFEINIINAPERESELVEILGRDLEAMETKWYSMEDDLMAASIQLPGVLIRVDVNGENSDDFRRYFFLDGESEKFVGEITYKGESELLKIGTREYAITTKKRELEKEIEEKQKELDALLRAL